MWSKIKTVGKTGVIPSRRSLAAYRPLHFFGAINGALCGSADKWGETHGVGTYPGLHYGDGGPDELKLQGGAAANAEREQGNEGGKNCEHAHDGMAVTRKSLAFLGLWEF